MSDTPAATIVIATRNRRQELERAVRSALRQDIEVEVLVADDASDDGTAEMLRTEFPAVRLFPNEHPSGPIDRRNELAEAALGEIIVSLDDDAELPSSSTVRQTLSDFDADRVGAVGIPFIDVVLSDDVVHRARSADGIWLLPTFMAAAAAYRRDVFLGVGGYRAALVRNYYEEPDLALRMMASGWVVRAGRAEPAMHYESPNRSAKRKWELARRNDILVACLTTPARALPRHLAEVTAGRRPIPFVSQTLQGYRAAVAHRHERDPVPASVFRARQLLAKRGQCRLEELESLLPPKRDFSERRPNASASSRGTARSSSVPTA